MRIRLAAAAVLLATAAVARGADPFVWTVSTTTGTPETVRVRGNNLADVTDAVVLGYGSARRLAGRDVTATLNYAGVPRALRLDLPADRASGTLRYTATGGPTDTFTAAGSPTAVPAARVIADQIYFDLTDPDRREYENLQQRVNRQSYIAPLDGNPSAATAFLAGQSFDKYAAVRVGQPPGYADGPRQLRFDPYGVPYGPEPARQLYQPVFWFDATGYAQSTNGFNGYDLRFSLNALGHFAPGIGWSVSIPYQYRQVDGAQSETSAVNFGVPVDIFTPNRRVPVGWTVTPFFEFGVSTSRDLGSTAGLFDGGVASRVTLDLGRRREWTLAYGAQFTGFVGLGAVRNDDYYYDDGSAYRGHLAQQVVKNGVQVIRRFRYGLSVDAGVTYSGFVGDAATDQWWSPRVGVAWQVSPNFALRLAYRGDLADHYTAQGGEFQIDFKY